MSDTLGEARTRDQAWTLSEEERRPYSIFSERDGTTSKRPWEEGDEDKPGFQGKIKA